MLGSRDTRRMNKFYAVTILPRGAPLLCVEQLLLPPGGMSGRTPPWPIHICSPHKNSMCIGLCTISHCSIFSFSPCFPFCSKKRIPRSAMQHFRVCRMFVSFVCILDVWMSGPFFGRRTFGRCPSPASFYTHVRPTSEIGE